MHRRCRGGIGQAGWPGLPRPKGQDKIVRVRVRVTQKIGIGSKRLWQSELSLEVQWTPTRANIAPPAALSAASYSEPIARGYELRSLHCANCKTVLRIVCKRLPEKMSGRRGAIQS